MKRKTTITITGEDGVPAVNFAVDFEPPLTDDKVLGSGWATATEFMLAKMQELAGGEKR